MKGPISYYVIPCTIAYEKDDHLCFHIKESTDAPNTTPTEDKSNPCMENIDIVDLLSKNFNGPKVFFNVGVEDKNY